MTRRRIGNFGLSEELIRYGFVVATVFVLDLALFYILAQPVGLNYTLSAVIAYITATIWNYFLSIKWAFAYRRLAGQLQEPLIFWLIALGGLLATVGLLNLFRNLGMGIVAAKFTSEATIAIVSFGSKKILLFTSWQDITEVLKWYRAAPLSVRIHVLIRRWTLPLNRLRKYVPPKADSILEIGTGYGLVLMVLAQYRYHHSPQVTMAGADIDENKLEHARLAAKNSKAKTEFFTKIPSKQKWQTVIIVDVLYLLKPAEQRAMINKALKSLSPGGTLLIKEMSFKPAWKFWLLKTQEFFSVKVFRITARKGSGKFYFIDLPKLAQRLNNQGYGSQLHRLDHGWLHPHLLLSVKKP